MKTSRHDEFYKLKRVANIAFSSIAVHEVISNLFEEDEEAKDILDGLNEFEEEEALFVIHNDSNLYENNYYIDIIESDLNYFVAMH